MRSQEQRQFQARFEPRVEACEKTLGAVAEACKSNSKAKAAFDSRPMSPFSLFTRMAPFAPAAAAVVALGCAHASTVRPIPPPASEPVADGPTADERRAFAYYDEQAKIVERTKNDCAAMGEALDAWMAKNGDDARQVIARVHAARASMPSEARRQHSKAVTRAFGDRAFEVFLLLSIRARNCADDPRVAAVLAMDSGSK